MEINLGSVGGGVRVAVVMMKFVFKLIYSLHGKTEEVMYSLTRSLEENSSMQSGRVYKLAY